MVNSSADDPYPSPFLSIMLLQAQVDSLSTPDIVGSTFVLPSQTWGMAAALCVLLVALFRSTRTAVFSLSDTDQIQLDRTSATRRIKLLLQQADPFSLAIRWTADLWYAGAAMCWLIALCAYVDNALAHLPLLALVSALSTWLCVFIAEFILSPIATRYPMALSRFWSLPSWVAYTLWLPFTRWWQNRYKTTPTLSAVIDTDVFQHDPPIADDPSHPNSGDNSPSNDIRPAPTRAVSKFKSLSVKQVMCNRIDIYAVEKQTDFKTLCHNIINWGYSRIPVYEEDLDHIVGILYIKELLRPLTEDIQFEWQSLIKPPFFVPQNNKVDDLLREMQRSRTHLAIAVDEFGNTSGLITLEDILEEIVGDIRDEYDIDENTFKRLSEHQYIFNGKTPLSDICRTMQLAPDLFDTVRGESESLGGLLIELAGKFPDEKETITYDRFRFTVLARHSNRIDEVKITLLPSA